MTSKELNRDVLRLNKQLKVYLADNDNNYTQYIENVAKKEFFRLYLADEKFEYMSKKSVLIMLRLNLRYRFMALHSFGIHIQL